MNTSDWTYDSQKDQWSSRRAGYGFGKVIVTLKTVKGYWVATEYFCGLEMGQSRQMRTPRMAIVDLAMRFAEGASTEDADPVLAWAATVKLPF